MARKISTSGTISSWFYKVFGEHKDWLKLDNNKPIRDLWKQEHGSDMPPNVANVMTNVKGKLRGSRRGRRKGGKPGPKPKTELAAAPARTPKAALAELVRLEGRIDDCLATARAMNVENIQDVIHSLRNARNGIVRMFVNQD